MVGNFIIELLKLFLYVLLFIFGYFFVWMFNFCFLFDWKCKKEFIKKNLCIVGFYCLIFVRGLLGLWLI